MSTRHKLILISVLATLGMLTIAVGAWAAKSRIDFTAEQSAQHCFHVHSSPFYLIEIKPKVVEISPAVGIEHSPPSWQNELSFYKIYRSSVAETAVIRPLWLVNRALLI